MNWLKTLTYALVIIGALNWGFVALGVNVIEYTGSTITTIAYYLIGLSAVYMLFTNKMK